MAQPRDSKGRFVRTTGGATKKVIFDGRRTGNRVIEVDRGARRIFARIANIRGKGSVAKVGLIGDLADRATHNEFGAPRANVPERSFIRSTFDEERPNMLRIRNNLMEAILFGSTTVKEALLIVALYLESKIKQKIVELSDPPNAPSTIEKKGFNNPLVETLRMRDGVTSTVE
jgi:hypothetical protein